MYFWNYILIKHTSEDFKNSIFYKFQRKSKVKDDVFAIWFFHDFFDTSRVTLVSARSTKLSLSFHHGKRYV